jgi:hypothetical protein
LADGELEKASSESRRLNALCQDEVVKFERKRLWDLKESLRTFLKVEIAMHAKALELYSQAYDYVDSIDVEADLDVS